MKPHLMTELLSGKTAVVTGAASGIGRGIALTLAEHGANIVVADINEEPQTSGTIPTIEAIEDQTDVRCAFVECDVRNRADLVDAADLAEELGILDVWVNNAGIVHFVDFFETEEDDFLTLMDINLKGVFFGSQVAGERMLDHGGGSIINISSTTAEQGFVEPGSILYGTAKGGVKSMTFGLADLMGPDVRVNAIQPGFTDETGLAENQTDEHARSRAAETAMDRLGLPQDVGNVAVFLASDLSSYITAQGIYVDGGWVNVGGP